VERIDEEYAEFLFEQVPEYVVTVMSGGFEPYFYFGQIGRNSTDLPEKVFKALSGVLDDERSIKLYTIRVADIAVMFVFGDVDPNIDHKKPPSIKYSTLFRTTDSLIA
jgi:hypothetical protein